MKSIAATAVPAAAANPEDTDHGFYLRRIDHADGTCTYVVVETDGEPLMATGDAAKTGRE